MANKKLTIKAVDVPGVSWKKYFVMRGKQVVDGPHYSRETAKKFIVRCEAN